MKRNGDQLWSVKKKNIGSKRSEWCTYENFIIMYNLIYTAFENAGIAGCPCPNTYRFFTYALISSF